MDLSPEVGLNKQSINYKSFESPQLAHGSKPDVNKVQKEVPLHQLASGCFLDDVSANKTKESSSNNAPKYVYIACIIFAVVVTFATMLQVYLGENMLFVEGMLVSDHERCTAVGQRVLRDRGSSVDAAIAAVLCLGVVHPHVIGIGGGGVMLVHNTRKNETKVLNFQGVAPKGLKEEMLQSGFRKKAGLLVGVPGMLRGLHQAHRLYGSLSWQNVAARAAVVAREGFNVSQSLASAISNVKGDSLMGRFRATFFPDGRALRPGSFLRMPSVARLLQVGLSNFYSGNLSQEMEEEVRAQGGVLSREDISNYIVDVGQPLEGLYKKFRILVPAHPSAAAALLLTAKLLEGFNKTDRNQTVLRWTSKALKEAVRMGISEYNSSMTELLSDMLRKGSVDMLRPEIWHSLGSPPEDQSRVHTIQKTALMAGQVEVMGPDGLMVSMAGSLSRPFGSRILTRSGIILNSLILEFYQTNKAGKNQGIKIQPDKRPALSALTPTIVVPAWRVCGTYMALSLSLAGLVERPDGTIVQSLFPEDRVQTLNESAQRVERLRTVVHGVLRNQDVMQEMYVFS
ncbi:glutathione hydrolase 7-like isoform X1 [Entelurus aequoreus]|uniref:glutathione hydrolase 7-like isoform X1 n=1 Tax=Entelurus aequoreus TaxID=161455 RepID=UPI002B1E13F6|nr:glutathione hydrolase 7-like isoform X1 [Entelurus aequoreus]